MAVSPVGDAVPASEDSGSGLSGSSLVASFGTVSADVGSDASDPSGAGGTEASSWASSAWGLSQVVDPSVAL